MKYILISGDNKIGNRASITCSIGLILKSLNLTVTVVQIDLISIGMEGYEKTVLNDESASSLDIGRFERFLDIELTARHFISKNQSFNEKENISDEDFVQQIQTSLEDIAHLPINGKIPEICLIDMAGNKQNKNFVLYFEALNKFFDKIPYQMHLCVEADDQLNIQSLVEQLKDRNLSPNIIVGKYSSPEMRENILAYKPPQSLKIVTYSSEIDVLQLPQEFVKQNLDVFIREKLNLDIISNSLLENTINLFSEYSNKLRQDGVPIGVVCEYTDNYQYIAVSEAFQHSIIFLNKKFKIIKIKPSHLEEKNTNYENAWETLKSCLGIMVAGGSGFKGSEGRIKATQYARINKIPFLGVCYGMQFATIEFARNVCKLNSANTTEVDPDTAYPIFSRITNERNENGKNYGSNEILIKSNDCRSRRLFDSDRIHERHFNRYEFNKKYLELLSSAGMSFVGFSALRKSVEIIEIKEHPFFVATQFHPEFNSRFSSPSVFYTAFLKAIDSNI